ncbi:MAG: hypothetical protein AB1742_07425 [bacterium]
MLVRITDFTGTLSNGKSVIFNLSINIVTLIIIKSRIYNEIVKNIGGQTRKMTAEFQLRIGKT